MSDPRLEIAPYDFDTAARLAAELGVSPTLAQVLVRRGHDDPEAARDWLAGDEQHPPDAFAGLAEALEVIRGHVAAGSPITVHGDYDVDGVASTAVLVRALRRVGARVDWYLPSRLEDGYGLAAHTVARLAARGTQLLVTVDCAITAVDEVASARALGLDVVVTDHHQPRADGRLPDAPIVHPGLGGYPCPDLCAASVAYKLALALEEDTAPGEPPPADEDLDLVALATIADVVPLHGENRRLARAGLRALAGTGKPGLRALMRIAQVDPSGLDAHAVGFRLAPRINAAGRLRRADAGLELLLTEDPERAAAVAEELDQANAERRHTETRILFEAEAQVREAGERAAYVLAGEDWHPGVIGIVASRIAERHHRPAVLVALHGDRGTGSGRSIPAFDLLAGLDAGAAHLERHGGHRAAAGLEIRRDALDAFRGAFEAHAAAALGPEDLVPVERVDAVVPGDALALSLAEELERIGPCGAGNPEVNLLVPAAVLSDPRPMGEGKHVRFTVQAGGARSRAVAFGTSRVPTGEPVDATFRLGVNQYNGAVEPRLVLGSVRSSAPLPIEVAGEPGSLAAELARMRGAPAPAPRDAPDVAVLRPAHRVVDRCGHGIAGVVADLVATGEPVLVVVADVVLRLPALAERLGSFRLCSYAALEAGPGPAAGARHVVALDPPLDPVQDAALAAAAADPTWLHRAWGDPELAFAARVHERDHDLRAALATLYRAVRAGRGAAALPPQDVLAARLLTVLSELRLIAVDLPAPGSGGEPALRLEPAVRTDLQRSPTFRASEARRAAAARRLPAPARRAA